MFEAIKARKATPEEIAELERTLPEDEKARGGSSEF